MMSDNMASWRGRLIPVLGLLGWVGLCLLAGAVGSAATAEGVSDWYPTLDKPAWTPPAWVFAPVWSVLYVLMGVAAWLVWLRRGDPARRSALALFGVQLALNVAWSIIFFGLQRPGWAMIEIVLLWAAIVATLLIFWRVRPSAGGLLIPYLVWVSYAVTLNAGIWWLNP